MTRIIAGWGRIPRRVWVLRIGTPVALYEPPTFKIDLSVRIPCSVHSRLCNDRLIKKKKKEKIFQVSNFETHESPPLPPRAVRTGKYCVRTYYIRTSTVPNSNADHLQQSDQSSVKIIGISQQSDALSPSSILIKRPRTSLTNSHTFSRIIRRRDE